MKHETDAAEAVAIDRTTMLRFPARAPFPERLQDGTYDHLIVDTAEAHAAALADGYFETAAEARAAGDAALAEAAALAAEEAEAKKIADAKALLAAASDAPPTRAELEAKATELGIAFKPNWGAKKLSDAIDAALAAKD